ncbi:MAG: hypothetical protein EBX40_03085 [Gammaproteobacteria bacterium]|nr:hypothetical protein [Gammaproteobacteria bacterium]
MITIPLLPEDLPLDYIGRYCFEGATFQDLAADYLKQVTDDPDAIERMSEHIEVCLSALSFSFDAFNPLEPLAYIGALPYRLTAEAMQGVRFKRYEFLQGFADRLKADKQLDYEHLCYYLPDISLCLEALYRRFQEVYEQSGDGTGFNPKELLEFAVVDDLAGGDLTKHESIKDTPTQDVYLKLQYNVRKAAYEKLNLSR